MAPIKVDNRLLNKPPEFSPGLNPVDEAPGPQVLHAYLCGRSRQHIALSLASFALPHKRKLCLLRSLSQISAGIQAVQRVYTYVHMCSDIALSPYRPLPHRGRSETVTRKANGHCISRSDHRRSLHRHQVSTACPSRAADRRGVTHTRWIWILVRRLTPFLDACLLQPFHVRVLTARTSIKLQQAAKLTTMGPCHGTLDSSCFKYMLFDKPRAERA